MDIVTQLLEAFVAAGGIIVIVATVYTGYVIYRAIRTARQVTADLSNVVVLAEWREERAQ